MSTDDYPDPIVEGLRALPMPDVASARASRIRARGERALSQRRRREAARHARTTTWSRQLEVAGALGGGAVYLAFAVMGALALYR